MLLIKAASQLSNKCKNI